MTEHNIGKAIVLLHETYKKAEKQDFVQKPISYALFHTWKYFDSIEKERVKNDRT